MARSKLSTRERVAILKQFRSPEGVAKRTGASVATVKKWFSGRSKPAAKYEAAINKASGTVLSQERMRASRSGYEMPPAEAFVPARRMTRLNPVTNERELTESIEFDIPTGRDRKKAEKWLAWAKEKGYTIRAIYHVGVSGESIDGETYPAETLSTSFIDLSSVKQSRVDQLAADLYGERGRFVDRFIVVQDAGGHARTKDVTRSKSKRKTKSLRSKRGRG